MLKCKAILEFDPHTDIFTVEVSGDNGITEVYLIPLVEAQSDETYKAPEDYAAMTAIRLFMEDHEKAD
jgi:hypothetical protein